MPETLAEASPYQPYLCWFGTPHPNGYKACGKPARKYKVTREGWLTCDMWLCQHHATVMRQDMERKYTLLLIEGV